MTQLASLIKSDFQSMSYAGTPLTWSRACGITLSPHPKRGEGRVTGASGHSTIGFISERNKMVWKRLRSCSFGLEKDINPVIKETCRWFILQT